ncbi:MAG: C4-dicarboxylate ABC transporter [Desulfobulbaceae bacterium A2]|nr:MAG: C4-dicarboxylate ABC transporter [Desulfobulbaceae bacterium A2]
MPVDPTLFLFAGLFLLLFLGVPLGVAFGCTGMVVIFAAKLGVMSIPINVYSGIAKYPLLALPVFILAGMLFERAGIAVRLVRVAQALIGNRRGGLGLVAILVCMFLGGISGSGPADAAAVAGVLLPAMSRQGYPAPFSASLIAAAGSTAILIPPSVAFIIYAVLMPGVSLPTLFAAGLIPGVLAGISLMLPTLWFARRNGWGDTDSEERLRLWPCLREASWGLLAPVIVLGGMRSGIFTPTEAAVIAAVYGLLVGVFVYRSLDARAIWAALAESAEMSAIVLIIVGLVTVFAHAGSALGSFEIFAHALLSVTDNGSLAILLIMAFLFVAGMFIDAISIYLVFVPVFTPMVLAFGWDPVWFGVVMTMCLAVGQFTPPMAVNLMVTSRIGGVSIESTVPWVIWLVLSMSTAVLAVIFLPELALWLPRTAGFK